MPKRACDGCSIRKIRCEGTQPCRACVKAGLSCTFLKALRKGGPRKPHQKTIQQIHKTQIEFSKLAGGLQPQQQQQQPQQQQPQQQPQPPTSNPNYYDDSGDSPSSPSGFSISMPSTPERLDSFESRRHNRLRRDDGYETDELEFELGGSSTTSSASRRTFEPHFPVSVLAIYLEIFHHRLYPTWPIINHKELLARLKERPLDPEVYCLAITMACATMEQLQLPPWTHRDAEQGGEILVSSDRLAAEALKLRRKFGLAERPSTNSVLMGLFLHVYFENKKKYVTATLYLREAVSYVQVLRLDRERTYDGMDAKEEMFKRRVFWLLFITERGHTMVHDMPFVLRNTISMPSFNATHEPLLVGFMNLVQLFASFDQSVIDAWISGDRFSCSKDLLEAMQLKLSLVSPDESAINETQKTDILITKHWMRTLVWQVAMSHGFLSSSGGKSEGMSMGFPAEVAGDLLGLLGTVTRENVECHGPGMELKLFEVTNSLADVILCVPQMKPSTSTTTPSTTTNPATTSYGGTMRFGPRDYLKSLFDLMVNFRGGNPTLINIIKNKASQLLVNEPGCDRFLELPDRDENKQQHQSQTQAENTDGSAQVPSLPNINRGFAAEPGSHHVHCTPMEDNDVVDVLPEFSGAEYTWQPDPTTASNNNNTPSPKFSDTNSNSRSDPSSPVPNFGSMEVRVSDPRLVGMQGDYNMVTGDGEGRRSNSGSPGIYVDSSGVDWTDEIMADVRNEWTGAGGNRAAVTTWIKDVE